MSKQKSIPQFGIRDWYAWCVLLMMLLFMVINFADKAILGLAANSMMAELGITASQYGALSSAFFSLFCVSSLCVGLLVDKFPANRILLIMAIIWTVSMLPISLGAGFVIILLSRIVLGAAEGPAFPVSNYTAHQWFPQEDRSLASGVVSLGVPLGVIVAAPVGEFLIASYGWRTAFLVFAIASALWALAWFFIGRRTPAARAEDVRKSGAAGDQERSISVLANANIPYRRILLTGTWLGSVSAGFAAYYAVSLLVAWLPVFLEDSGYEPAQTAQLVILPWVVNGIGLVVQAPALRWLVVKGVSGRVAYGLIGSGCVLLAGLAMFAFLSDTTGPLAIVMMSLGFGLGAVVFAISQAACAQISPPNRRGGVLGLYGCIYATAGIIAPFVTGLIIESMGVDGYTVGFSIAGGVLLVGGCLGVTFVHPERDLSKLSVKTHVE